MCDSLVETSENCSADLVPFSVKDDSTLCPGLINLSSLSIRYKSVNKQVVLLEESKIEE